MYNNSIILSSCLYGSIFIFSTSLCLINNSLLLENKKISRKLVYLNGLVFVISSYIYIYTLHSFYKIKKLI
jgi:uncharacterized membrane protein